VRRTSKVIGVAIIASVIGLGSWTGTSAAGDAVARPKLGPARFGLPAGLLGADHTPLAALAAGSTVPEYVTTINDHGTSFKVRIVGKNPAVQQANPVTTIPTQLIPIVFKIAGATFDPRVGDSCDATSALTRTKKSPIFVKQTYSSGGLALGTGQYVDIVQRAQSYKFTKPGALNPNYHVTLQLSTPAVVTLTVPNASAALFNAPCGNFLMGGVDITWFMNVIKNSVMPQLHASFGVGPTTFPLFLVYNTVFCSGSCGILGFHNSISTSAGQQTYGVADYDNTGNFGGNVADVSVMSHEVSEWMNDPGVGQSATINLTKQWGNIGQVSGCQGNFETGDPLSGHVLTDTLNGKTYHLQELAYAAWFYHQSPSPGLHGTYSFQGAANGRFTGSAKPCPPGGTN
jgi:hypothetical protein